VAFGIVLRAIQTYGDLNVSIPSGPPFFRFSDPIEAKRTLSVAGFKNPSVTHVDQIWRLSAPGELFEIVYSDSVRNAALLRAQTADALQSIRKAITREVKACHGILPMPAVLASADRP
jgi:hypothetical protein